MSDDDGPADRCPHCASNLVVDREGRFYEAYCIEQGCEYYDSGTLPEDEWPRPDEETDLDDYAEDDEPAR